MTREETQEIMQMLAFAYPNFYKDKSKEFRNSALDVWAIALLDYSFDFITAGVKGLLQTKTFPPAVAEVIESAKKQPNTTDPLQQPYVPLYLYDSSGNAIRSKDGHFLLNTPENQKLLDSPKLRIAE